VTQQVEEPCEPLATGSGQSPEDPEAFGSAVHKLLEWAVYNRETLPAPSRRKSMAQKFLEEKYPGFEEEDLERAVNMLEAFRESAIWEDLQNASAVHPEQTLTWRENGTVLRGTIDLVYATSDTWHIVDYKTDQIGEGSVLGSLEGHKYAGQVRQYASAWKKIVGENVASASLWFAETGETVGIR
jgi:ATP-dependent exoDNAse (exonuclease V) beta subunit